MSSFKYFMNFKGEEGRYMGLDGTDDGYLYALLQESAKVGKPTMVLHTENIEIVNRLRREIQAAGRETLKDWAAAKPPVTESEPSIRAMFLAQALSRGDVRDLPALPDAHRGHGPRRHGPRQSAVPHQG